MRHRAPGSDGLEGDGILTAEKVGWRRRRGKPTQGVGHVRARYAMRRWNEERRIDAFARQQRMWSAGRGDERREESRLRADIQRERAGGDARGCPSEREV